MQVEERCRSRKQNCGESSWCCGVRVARTGKLLQRVAARAAGFMSPRVQSPDFAHELRATGPVTMAV